MVDAEQLCGLRAEDADRLGRGRGVQVAAPGDGRADGREQVQGRRLNLERVGVDGRDQRAAVDVGAGRARVGDLGDRADPADHPGGGQRQLGGAAEQRLPGGDGEQVGAELVDLGEQPGLGGRREAEHGDDRRDADRDPERREPGAQPPGADADARDPGEVARAQLLGCECRGCGHAPYRPGGWLTSANAAGAAPLTVALTM